MARRATLVTKRTGYNGVTIKSQVAPLAQGSCPIMAMSQHKIIFTDGTTQTLTSPGPTLTGDWFTFADGSGTQLCVRAEEVQSIVRVGVEERSSADSVKAA